MKVIIRGYHFDVQAKLGSQLDFAVRRLKTRTDEQLQSYERESYPERAGIRQAYLKVCAVEELLREVLLDKMDAAEEELAKATFAVYDDYVEDDDGNSVVYSIRRPWTRIWTQ